MKATDWILGGLALACLPALAGQPGWRQVPFTEPEAIHGLCSRGDTLWAAFDGGVRASADDGATWSETGSGFRPGKVSGIAAGVGHLAACQGRLLFLSGDGGRTWIPRDSLEVGAFVRMDAWKDTLFGWHTLFADNAPGGVRFSIDDGLSWNPLPIEAPPLPRARVFASDTFSFSNGTIYRVNSGGPEEMHAFEGHIQALAPTGHRLFALMDSLVFAATDPHGHWAHIPTRSGPASAIRSIAADSDAIAVATPMGISLSRNRGRDWQFLATQSGFPAWQGLHLSRTGLYVQKWPDNGAVRRYSLAEGTWDSLALPWGSPNYTPAFAAGGDRVAWFGHYTPSRDSIFVSRGPEGRFRYTGIAPSNDTVSGNLLLGRDSVLVFLSQFTVRYSRNDGADWGPKPAVGCKPGINPFYAALGDSGLYLLNGEGLARIPPEAEKCGSTRLQVPDGKGGLALKFAVPARAIAATGGSVYVGMQNELWVREDSAGTTTPIRAKPGIRRRAVAQSRFPVRVWARPGRDGRTPAPAFDARGAARRVGGG